MAIWFILSISLNVFGVFSSLLVDYKFSSNFGQIFYDYSENGNHGQNGESISSSSSDTKATDRGAFFSSSFTDFILLPPNEVNSKSLSITSTFSIAMWCLSFDTRTYMLTYRGLGTTYYISAERISNGNFYRAHVKTPTYNSGAKTGTGKITKNIWNFLTITSSVNKMNFWINGVVSVTISLLVDYVESGIYKHYIGYTSGSFEGFVWSYQVYTSEIDPTLFIGSSSGNCLVATCTTCDPSLLIQGVSYCISTNSNDNKNAQGNPCSCNNFGCSSSTCLDCSSCISGSCIVQSASSVCICLNGTGTKTSCNCPLSTFYLSSNFTCCSCAIQCKTCLNSYECLTCVDANAILTPAKDCSCLEGFFNLTALSSGGVCVACNFDCKTCAGPESCLVCKDINAELDLIGCKCFSGYFNDSGLCSPCEASCLTCSQRNLCDSCLSQFSSPGPVIGCQCLPGYFNLSSLIYSQSCLKCFDECSECTSAKLCTSCIASDSSPDTNEGCRCFAGYYNVSALTTRNSCIPCPSECLLCENNSICIECKDPVAVLTNSGCSCPTNAFLDSTGFCVLCQDQCLTCSTSTDCLSCKDPNGVPSSFGCSCPDSYFNSTSTNLCEPCLSTCQTCLSTTACLVCKDRNSEVLSGNCICKASFFNSNEGLCESCPVGCVSCLSATDCLACQEPAVLEGGFCFCPSSFYMSSEGTCLECHSDCSVCTSFESCSECKDLHANIMISGFIYAERASSRCRCIPGYFNSSSNYKLTCSKCLRPCEECLDSTYCLSCAYQSMNLVDGKCFCPDYSEFIGEICVCNLGYYLEFQDGLQICKKCHQTCKTCSGGNKTECISCKESFILSENSCFYCEKGYFFNIKSKECKKCGANCLECLSESQCLLCKDESTLVNGGCIICAKGYYFYLNTCKKCPDLCSECIDECTECVENAEIFNKTCECSPGFKKVASGCSAKYFYGTLDVLKNNNLELRFTEATLTAVDLEDLIFHLNTTDPFINIDSIKLLKNFKNSSYLFSLILSKPLLSLSKLSLKITRNPLFSSNFSKLFNYSYEVTVQPEKYVLDNSYTAVILNTTKAATKIIVSSSLGTSIVSSPGVAWSLLNTIQLIAFLPLNSNPLTPTLKDFLTSFSSYNIIPNPLECFFDLDASSEPYLEARRFGISTSVFLINVGSNFLVFVGFLMIWPVFYFLSRKTSGKFAARMNILHKNYKFRFFLRAIIQGYLEIGIYSLVQLKAVRIMQEIINKEQGYFNQTVACVGIVLVFLSPYFTVVFTYINKVKVFTCNQEFFDKWGSFYDELKLDKGFWSSQFYFFYFTRRLGYLLFQVYLNNNLFLQGALNILLSLLTLVYLLKFMPFKEKVLMATTLLGEVCVNLVFGFSYAFVFGISEKIKAILELCIIFTVIFGIAGQFLIAFYLFFKGIIELWIKLEKARALQFADTAKKTIPELIENSIEEKRSESDRLSNLAEHISK